MYIKYTKKIQHKYNSIMEIGKEIQEKVIKNIDQLGFRTVEAKSKVNYRTLKKIVDTGICTYAVFGRIVAFLEAEAIENKEILSKI